MPSMMRRLLATIAFLVLLMSAAPSAVASAPSSAGAAFAPSIAMGTISAGGGADSATICPSQSLGASEQGHELLPVQRWGDSLTFHSRLGWTDVGDKLFRNGIMAWGMGLGNAMWSTTTGIVQFASAYCPVSKAGGLMDKTFAKIGRAFVSSPLLAMIFAGFVVAIAFRAARNGSAGIVRTLMQRALIAAVLVVMVTGASRSTGGDLTGRNYEPGLGSPGWFVSTIDQITSTTTSSLTVGLIKNNTIDQESVPNGNPGFIVDGPYSCPTYVKNMKDAYVSKFLVGGKNYGAAAALPLAINSMWEETGLRAWKQAQFGIGSNYGEIVYCRMAEFNTAGVEVELNENDASVDPATSGTIEGIMGFELDDNAMAWRGSTVNAYRDRIYTGLAACSHHKGYHSWEGWYVEGERSGLIPDNSYDEPSSEECTRLFADNNDSPKGSSEKRDGSSAGGDANAFDWEDGGGKIDGDDELSAADRDYLKTLHGVSNSAGFVTVLIFVLSSFLLMLVFGAFAISVIIAKTIGLVMIVGVIGALVGSLLPGADGSRLVQYGKKYFGTSLFAYAASLLLAVVTLISTVLIDLGNATLPDAAGGTLRMLWVGLAPVMAVVAVHWIAKQAKIPSPVAPQTGLAFGRMAASGALGQQVVSGFDRRAMNRNLDRAAQGLRGMRKPNEKTAPRNDDVVGKVGAMGTGAKSQTATRPNGSSDDPSAATTSPVSSRSPQSPSRDGDHLPIGADGGDADRLGRMSDGAEKGAPRADGDAGASPAEQGPSEIAANRRDAPGVGPDNGAMPAAAATPTAPETSRPVGYTSDPQVNAWLDGADTLDPEAASAQRRGQAAQLRQDYVASNPVRSIEQRQIDRLVAARQARAAQPARSVLKATARTAGTAGLLVAGSAAGPVGLAAVGGMVAARSLRKRAGADVTGFVKDTMDSKRDLCAADRSGTFAKGAYLADQQRLQAEEAEKAKRDKRVKQAAERREAAQARKQAALQQSPTPPSQTRGRTGLNDGPSPSSALNL